MLPSKDPQPGASSEGFSVIEVDDILEAGGAEHVKCMQKLEAMLKFRKIEDLQLKEATAARFFIRKQHG